MDPSVSRWTSLMNLYPYQKDPPSHSSPVDTNITFFKEERKAECPPTTWSTPFSQFQHNLASILHAWVDIPCYTPKAKLGDSDGERCIANPHRLSCLFYMRA